MMRVPSEGPFQAELEIRALSRAVEGARVAGAAIERDIGRDREIDAGVEQGRRTADIGGEGNRYGSGRERRLRSAEEFVEHAGSDPAGCDYRDAGSVKDKVVRHTHPEPTDEAVVI